MKLSFIFSNLNAIVLAIWIVFLIIVAIRFFRPTWVRNISFFKLILITIGLNIFYGLFVTWGQYYVWAINDYTGTFIKLPYFIGYVFTHFWLNIFISFLISGILYFLFKVWKFYRGGFIEQGPELLLVLMLISGYPRILVLIPLGFIFSILLFGFYYLRTVFKRVPPSTILLNIEPAFILATFFALLFTRIILNMVQ